MHDIVRSIQDNLTRVILGKDDLTQQVLVALFSGGNMLLEDVPGAGKTTLAKALAKSVNADYNRIQFTPDLLPADILGSSIFNLQTSQFTFSERPDLHKYPVGRRNQPGIAPDTVGIARSHDRAASDNRRGLSSCRCTVHRDRYTESDRIPRHLPVTGSPTRSIFDAPEPQVPGCRQ